jgi:hypothetical protein
MANWRGTWNAGSPYAVNDSAGYAGTVWVCQAANTGQVPTPGTYWAAEAVLDGPLISLSQVPANWGAADQGLIAWNYDGSASTVAGSVPLATAGTMYVIAMRLYVPALVTNILTEVFTIGNTLTSGQCFAALYQGPGGALLGVTADQSAAWTSGGTGAKTMAISGGPVPAAAGVVYAGFWFNGTTGPALWRTSSTSTFMNLGLTAAASRWGTANTGLTNAASAPATLGTISAAATAYWAGLS